jgi:hypothetical protein
VLRSGPKVEFNKEGNAYVRTSGVEFEFEITSPNYEDLQIQRVEVTYQLTDRRFHRGPSASSPAADTDLE